MRLCALAESSTEKSAASDITLVLLSRSPVLITQIKSLMWAWLVVQGHPKVHIMCPTHTIATLINHVGLPHVREPRRAGSFCSFK